MHALSSFHSDLSSTVVCAAKIEALLLAAAGVTINRLARWMASPAGALACRYFGVSSELAIPERAELAHSARKQTNGIPSQLTMGTPLASKGDGHT